MKWWIPALLVCLTLFANKGMGQEMTKDEMGGKQRRTLDSLHFTQNKFINNIFRQAINSVKKTPDAGEDESYLEAKSEEPYMRYQGKIIRHIFINTFNFNRSFTDTTYRDKSFATKFAMHFHRVTRTFVVRDNLFIKENTPLNAYKLADNERFLRTLEYLQDARIIVLTIDNIYDSVDIIVYTKDLFSIAGGASSQLLNHVTTNLYETNLAGMGQRLEINTLYDYNRGPAWGYGALYRKNNVAHSFTDATIAYSTINGNPFTREEETSSFINLNRRLVSPYSRVAGALTVSQNEAYNVYRVPDAFFYKYRYNLFDAWAGYSIGIKQLTATNNTIRDRRFLAFRFTDRNFTATPGQVGLAFDPVFNDTRSVLGQFTFFRQDYIKTQYVYGFGTTEDIPYGYNISITGGWHKQIGLERPYAGFSLTDYIVTPAKDYIQLFLRAGGFRHKNQLQDASFLAGATAFSRVLFWNKVKIRNFARASYTQLFDRVTYPQLRIDNYFGIRGFLSDSAYGTKRISLQLETEFFLERPLLGFRFAPFTYADFTVITPENKPFGNSSLYTSLGGGVRARNPNLVFETIEVRAYFFPVAPDNMRGFKIVTTSNIRFRYNSSYVTAPDVVQLNGE
ncbi:MAG: hypothetical protein H7257_08800 [Taibaiella sp.]|nr:hypothetical protein [Taibaiella sp.]